MWTAPPKNNYAENGVLVGFIGYSVDFPVLEGIGESNSINSLPKFCFSASGVVGIAGRA